MLFYPGRFSVLLSFGWLVSSCGFYECLRVIRETEEFFAILYASRITWKVGFSLFFDYGIWPAIIIAGVILVKDRYLNEAQRYLWNWIFAIFCGAFVVLGVWVIFVGLCGSHQFIY